MDDLQWHKLLILCCHCTEKIEALDIEMSGCGERERGSGSQYQEELVQVVVETGSEVPP